MAHEPVIGELPTASTELPLLGETFAIELANSSYDSTSGHVDYLGSPRLVREWFSRAPEATGLSLPREVAPDLVHDLVGVRDAVRALLEQAAATGRIDGPGGASAVTTLHAAARRACAHVVLEGTDGAAGSGWALAHDGAPVDVIVAAVASRCLLFVGGEDLDKVRTCARPACSMLFVRHHRARRFCHESCAHSVRQARYYRARAAR